MNDTLAPIVGLLVVAFITPGPNNFIVMGAATRGGFLRTLPIILGIVFGTVGLYFLTFAGLAQLLALHNRLGNILLVAGVGYLAFLGVRMIVQQAKSASVGETAPEPSLIEMALFQGMNPKSVILIATVAAATPDSIKMPLAVAAVMAMTAAFCLVIWAMAGAAFSNWLLPPARRRAFDVAMGLLLIASAIMLLLFGWGEMP